MPNNTVKTLKNVKNADKAHPQSRKAAQINRANVRTARITKQRGDTNKLRGKVVDRIVWFKYAVDEEASSVSKEDLHELIDMYISRNDDEIETLTKQLRKGRPKPARLVNLEMLRQTDLDEYHVGMEVPDFTDAKLLEFIRNWEADYNTLAKIKMVRLRSPLAEIEEAANKAKKEKTEGEDKVEKMEEDKPEEVKA